MLITSVGFDYDLNFSNVTKITKQNIKIKSCKIHLRMKIKCFSNMFRKKKEKKRKEKMIDEKSLCHF